MSQHAIGNNITQVIVEKDDYTPPDVLEARWRKKKIYEIKDWLRVHHRNETWLKQLLLFFYGCTYTRLQTTDNPCLMEILDLINGLEINQSF